MNAHLKTLAGLALISALAAGHAQTTAPDTSSSKKPVPHKRKIVPAKPSIQNQLEELRQGLQSQQDQIQELRHQLSERDQQLQQAQQAAEAAQAAATQAQQNAQQQSAVQTQNSQAVSDLQGAVSGLKANTATLATTVQTQQTTVRNEVEHPDAIRFKGITLSPTGSFLAGETVWRQRATGGDINTSFTALPLPDQPEYYYSEFYGSGRQSRIAMLGQGTLDNMTLRGYYEADFLSAGTTSNNNQSNSYTLRQRQVWAQAELNSGWTFTGGQMWSLATETSQGMTNRSELLPLTIDPQYEPGFVWARQYGFRVTKDFGNKVWFGVSAENPQVPSVAGHGLPINFLVGQLGTGGGLYNATANYASNPAPDVIAKMVFEPGWGHYEVYGIGRFFRDRVYPNDSGSTPTAAGAYNDNATGGGIGGSFRIPTLAKHLDIGLSGLWGDGIGRYGDSQIADTTTHPDGTLALIHGFSALSSLTLHATPRLDVYANYGGDEAFRTYYLTAPTKVVGYGSYLNNTSGCYTETPPATGNAGYTPGSNANCTADTKDIQQFTAGYWYDFYKGPAGRLRQGFQYTYARRNIWSGTDGAPEGPENMWWTSFRYYLP